MPSPAIADRKKIPTWPALVAAVAVIVLVAGWIYLSRPPKPLSDAGIASAEAKAYLANIALSDVTVKATENFMQQQVVEVEGKIANNGPRSLESVDVFCLFYGVNGREIYRERVPIVRAKGAPLRTGESRSFRLPFDHVPDGWNQAMPRMVIAKITFAG
jgi:hypothetical protein